MSKHTPGPWEACAKHDPDPREGTHWIRCELGALGYWRGHKSYHDDSNWVLNEADARLIAAAPELLSALEAARDWFIDRPKLKGAYTQAKALDAAIAKATGATS